MEKKYVSELTNDELKKVYHANEKLQRDICDDMIEAEMRYIGEQLDYLRGSLSDWSIGAYGRNYISINKYDEFIANMEEMDKSVPALHDKQTKKLKEAVELREKYRNEDMYSDEYYELEQQLEDIAERLANMLVKNFTEILNGCYKEKNQIDYFTEFYSESRLESDKCYIVIEDENYILHEDISYTKTYN